MQAPRALSIAALFALAACDGGGAMERPDAGRYVGGDPASGCPGRLEPLEPAGLVETVGDGTAASCTEDALHAAVERVNGEEGGGTVLFDCGGEHTITLTRSVLVSTAMILDGGGAITLSGGGAVRVIELDHYVDFVLQRITITCGFVPAGSENESGAGLLHPWFGTLKVIDAVFEGNHSASLDHDVGGGAIYAGGLTEAVISGTTFSSNSGSTGGAILSRSTNLRVVDTVFFENTATSYAESGQYGNGGGLYIDRMWLDAPIDFVICGSVFDSNHATVHGSALFSYNLEGAARRSTAAPSATTTWRGARAAAPAPSTTRACRSCSCARRSPATSRARTRAASSSAAAATPTSAAARSRATARPATPARSGRATATCASSTSPSRTTTRTTARPSSAARAARSR
ncbi:MAG: hypothetical protein M5U28_37855 [Sandaracinaceae bacterium]|nr:hypothetical protein [Sandaracinaceae bacterium]